jgi:predicted small lipoprotein YifL
MKKSLAFAFVLVLASTLSACGNKGDLVRPTPSTLPPETTTPATPPADAPGKPAQGSNGP